MTRNKPWSAPEDRAWDALCSVEDHPKVKDWLAQADLLADARLPDLSRADLKIPRRHSRWAVAASVWVAVTAAIGGYWHWAPDRYETAVGEQRDVSLSDGSRMTLNTDTAVSVRYSRGRRYIEMQRGEALFAVKQAAKRPFEVAAGGTITRALGTEFNVDLRNSKVTVSVLDGAVRVVQAPGRAPQTAAQADRQQSSGEGPSVSVSALSKGQALEFRAQDGRMQEKKADLKRIDAWRTRRLEFTDTPLTDAVNEFNRYSTLHVVVGTPDLADVRVSGVFRIGDAEGFIYSLREALKLETHEGPGEVVLMRDGNGK